MTLFDLMEATTETPAVDPERQARIEAYQAKRAARVERLEAVAAKATERSTEAYQRARKATEHIPFGQPMIIGHHSESGHRAALKRRDNAMNKCVAEGSKAEHYERRAQAAATNGAIFSDDPQAGEKLADEIARLEARQSIMVAANKLVRKNDREGLEALGFTAAQVVAMMAPGQFGGQGFPSFKLTNNSANIRRLKQRLASIERKAADETTTTEAAPGVRIVENVEKNRCQIFFPGKPSEAIRKSLKGSGFRWAPSCGAWQRQRSNGATYYAQQIVKEYAAESAE